MKVLPIFLNQLDDRRCVVFGGNHEAERKVEDLLDCDAAVVVVSTSLTEKLQSWADEKRFEWFARDYEPGDLKDTFLAIVSVIDPEKTEPIWQEAQERKVLFNAMDDIPHCTFVSGSVIKRGPLIVSISSSGCAPTLAVRLRQQLEKLISHAHGSLAELMGSMRERMQRDVPEFAERRRLWYQIVDSDVLQLIESGRRDLAMQRMEEIVDARMEM